MLCGYLDPSVKTDDFGSRYQELDLTGYQELNIDLYSWTIDYGRTRVKRLETLFLLIFYGGNPQWPPRVIMF